MSQLAEDQLAAFVDRILRLKTEADDIASDIKEIYAEAKANGFDKTRLGDVVTKARKMEKDATGESEKEALRDLYWTAYCRAKKLPHTHAYARDDEDDLPEHDFRTGEITEPQLAPQAGSDLTEAHLLSSGQVADIQPETANTVPSIDGVNAPMMVAADANVGGENVAAHHSVDTVEKTDFVDDLPRAGVLVPSSDVETVAPSTVTTFTPKPLRPYCLNTDKCGGQGRKHCWSCQKAHDEKQGAA